MPRAKKSKPPAFQLYPKDLLYKTQHLSNEAFGIYVRLLFTAWDPPPAPDGEKPPIGHLPDDQETLAGIVRMTPDSEQWRYLFGRVLPFFDRDEKRGTLFQSRMVEVRREQLAYAKSRKDNGEKGGRPRKHEESTGKAYGNHMVSTEKPPANHSAGSSSSSSSSFEDHSLARARDPGTTQHAALAWGGQAFECLYHDLTGKTPRFQEHLGPLAKAIGEAAATESLDPGALARALLTAFPGYIAHCKTIGWDVSPSLKGINAHFERLVDFALRGVKPIGTQVAPEKPAERKNNVPDANETQRRIAEMRGRS